MDWLDKLKQRKGKDNPFYGKHHTKKWKKEQSKRMIGNKNPAKRLDVRKKLSKQAKKRIGNKNPNFNGKFHGIRLKNFKGKNNPNYIDGRTSLQISIRNLQEFKQWRQKVFERDFFTCQLCGYKGKNIEAHHIKPFAELLNKFLREYDQFSPIEDKETLLRLAMKWKSFWNIDNGKTLCEDCHKKETYAKLA